MACPSCGNSVLFGGIKEGNKRYCSKKCFQLDEINRIAAKIPDNIVDALVVKLHDGHCPKCHGAGPIDIHKSYSIYSVVIYTKWKTIEHLLCKKCATKQQVSDLAGSLLLGWWGIPFGILITPIISLSNVIAMMKSPGKKGPTKSLKRWARTMLANKEL